MSLAGMPRVALGVGSLEGGGMVGFTWRWDSTILGLSVPCIDALVHSAVLDQLIPLVPFLQPPFLVEGVEAAPLDSRAAWQVQCMRCVSIIKGDVKDSFWDTPSGCTQDCMGSLPHCVAMLVFAKIHHCVPGFLVFGLHDSVGVFAIREGMVAEALSAWHVAHLAAKFVDVVLDLRVEEVQPALACSLGSFVQVLTVLALFASILQQVISKVG